MRKLHILFTICVLTLIGSPAWAQTPEDDGASAPPADAATPSAPMTSDLEDSSTGVEASLEESDSIATDEESDWPMFTIAPHVSILLPQPFSDLGSWPVFGLELGFIVPFDAGSMKRPLQISVDVGYTQPAASGTDTAAALGEDGQSFDWELTQQMLTVDLTGLWRFMPPARGLSVYGEIGPRLYLMKTEVESSSAGQDFGTNDETKTQVGMVVAAGVEYWLAIGSVYGALEFGWSDLDTQITGDSNSGALTVDVGYRFMF